MSILGRLIIGFILTAGMYYFYDKHILSKLDIESQMVEFEKNFDPADYDIEEYDREEKEDDHYAYDDYDTGSDY